MAKFESGREFYPGGGMQDTSETRNNQHLENRVYTVSIQCIQCICTVYTVYIQCTYSVYRPKTGFPTEGVPDHTLPTVIFILKVDAILSPLVVRRSVHMHRTRKM